MLDADAPFPLLRSSQGSVETPRKPSAHQGNVASVQKESKQELSDAPAEFMPAERSVPTPNEG